MTYVVVMRESSKVWGPFEDHDHTQRFAAFIRLEVDPCDVELLCSPSLELLNWRDRVEQADPWAGEQPLTAEQNTSSSEGVRIMRGSKVLARIWPGHAYRLARDLMGAAIAAEEEPPF